MSSRVDTVIVGAGPYGLSLAAHLRKTGVTFCIFGKAMGTWLDQMPAGMSLKSEGFASDLYDPDGELTLEKYCKANQIEYARIGTPVKLDTFAAYGLEFQRRFVPNLVQSLVKDVVAVDGGFRVVLEDGTTVLTRRVVVAAGITHYQYLPPELAGLPSGVVSHSSRHHAFHQFKGQAVVVVGAGSSAVDVAAALHDAGARPELVTRRAKVAFHNKAPDQRSLLQQMRAPWSGLGLGWKSRLACDLPIVFHALPRKLRLHIVKTHLGPAPGWFTKEKIAGNVPMHVGMSLVDATQLADGTVKLRLSDSAGESRDLIADHVIAATGYRINLERLTFLSEALRTRIKTVGTVPALSRNFESSVGGLFFIGASAANSFGPLLRFAFGAGFTSRRLSRYLRAGARTTHEGKEGARILFSAKASENSVPVR